MSQKHVQIRSRTFIGELVVFSAHIDVCTPLHVYNARTFLDVFLAHGYREGQKVG